MSERDPRRHPIDELWPVPAPPRDLAQRVLVVLDRERRPRRRGPVMFGTLALAAGLALAWGLFWRHPAALDEDGGWVASARSTVDIGSRAAAAMEPGADLQWSVRKERVRVQQRRGSVFYRVDKGGPFQVTTPDGDVEVTGTCFRITHASRPTSTGTLVSVLEGSVNVRTSRGLLRLKAGETARLRSDRPPELVPLPPTEAAAAHDEELRDPPTSAELHPAPEIIESHPREAPSRERPSPLVLPPSTRLRVFGNPLDKVSLTVPAGRRAAVEVARDRQFRHPVFSGASRAPFVTVSAPSRGDLYWRLAGDTEPAGHARFLPEGRGGPERPVTNLVSEGRLSTTIHFQGAAPALTLAFAPGADRYRVRVARAAAPDRPILERIVAEPRCEIAAGLLAEGSYLWSAVPVDGDGRPLAHRPTNKLELAYDNARSTLAITRLTESEVQGVAPLGARLFVNGTAAAVDEKGRFAMKVGASRVLVFRLLSSDGSESYWVRSPGPRRRTL
jgi:hypothetical protein